MTENMLFYVLDFILILLKQSSNTILVIMYTSDNITYMQNMIVTVMFHFR